MDRKDRPADFPREGALLQTDIALPENLEMIFREAANFNPKIWTRWVNNAAYQIAKPLVETTGGRMGTGDGVQSAPGFF